MRLKFGEPLYGDFYMRADDMITQCSRVKPRTPLVIRLAEDGNGDAHWFPIIDVDHEYDDDDRISAVFFDLGPELQRQ